MDSLAECGADKDKLKVFRNGVDLERFRPEGRTIARARLGLPETRILFSVGNLVELKGHHIAIEALQLMPADSILIIAGSGPERGNLENLAQRLGVQARVRFAGHVANDELKWWYSAADALVLCSSREGWANVLLEAMACGTPVIATNVWGTPEVVSAPEAGRLMDSRSPEGLVHAAAALFANYPQPELVRQYAEKFDWRETSMAQAALFSRICNA